MSLATRISAFFLAALAVVLAGFSATLFLLARYHLQRDLDEHLIESLNALTAAAHIDPGMHGWKRGSRPAIVGVHDPDHPVRWVVYDGHGILLDRSDEAGSEDFSTALSRVPRIGHVHLSFNGRDGRPWRLAVRRLHRLDPGPVHGEVEDDREDGRRSTPWLGETSLILLTGTSQEPVEASLRNAGWLLAGVSTALWLLAALAGRRLGRRALRPVSRMAMAACSMSASDQQGRLPSPGTGDELEDLARSFNGLLGRLHEAFERQKRFTGEASHQLRTPLTALIGEVEVARRRERSVEDYRATLDQIHGDALRLRQIVEALLFLARAEAEAGLPDVEPIDLAAWLPDQLGRWAGHPRACDLHLVAPRDAPLRVEAHPSLLAQLLDNLLDNACKYSGPGTPVLIRAWREPEVVALAVEDRGPGLAADELPHVFEPFYRSPQARLRGDPGVGLGLAVVARIAATFGGVAVAESTPGQGCRFVVRFPGATARRTSHSPGPCPPVESSASP